MTTLSPASVTWTAVSLWLFLACVHCQVNNTQLPEYSVQLDDDGKFVFTWMPEEDHITIEIQVATQGYAGLGFSPAGGMRGADIILGWVDDDGTARIHDMHGVRNGAPLLDDSQDVVLLSGRRNDTHTTLRFRRPWVTCDQHHDMAISADTVRVISAYDHEKPVNLSNLQYHDYRGVRSMHLQETMSVDVPMTPDVKIWDVRAPNITLPSNLTTYWCNMFKFPEADVKHHYIAAQPLIAKKNRPFVHHMLLYECHTENSAATYERYLDLDGARCSTPRMPNSWLKCGRPLIVWAVGGEGEFLEDVGGEFMEDVGGGEFMEDVGGGESLPENFGIPLGEKWGGATYMMLEVHYENLDNLEGIVDDSGLRMFYTAKLRQYDGSLMSVGHATAAELVIPPLTPRWPAIGHCSSACTQATLPPEGIKIFAALLHSHLLGRAMILRHIRNGKELPPIVKDDTYDFNYQQYQVLKEERTVLPGDHLIFQCDYDTSSDTFPSFGGAGTKEEMCVAILMLYPNTALTRCESIPVLEDLFASLGVNSVYEEPQQHRRLVPIPRFAPGTTEKEKQQHLDAIEEEQYKFMLRGSAAALAEDPAISYIRWKDVMIKEPLGLQNMTFFDHVHERNLWLGGEAQARLLKAQELRFDQDLCDGIDEQPLAEFLPLPVPKFEPYKADPQRCFSPGGVHNPLLL
ncbi:Copper type II ascorbate-dependent monooxygenase C-terminal [Trinorchestia longiramus]|nr:Copper type II ascorbate-dependent monooxygenase C-terminal [Trinorchestia longiramus]